MLDERWRPQLIAIVRKRTIYWHSEINSLNMNKLTSVDDYLVEIYLLYFPDKNHKEHDDAMWAPSNK